MKARVWQDGVNLILGIWIFLTPWIVAHPMKVPSIAAGAKAPAMWNFFLTGAAIIVVSGLGLWAFRRWLQWINGALGAWLIASPWVVGFAVVDVLTWNAALIGIAVLVLVVWAYNKGHMSDA